MTKLEEEGQNLKSSLADKDLILKNSLTEIDSLKSSVDMKNNLIDEYEKKIGNLNIELNNQVKKIQINTENTSKLEDRIKILKDQKSKLDEKVESLLCRLKIIEESHQAEQDYWLKEIKESKNLAKKLRKKALVYKRKLKDISEATVNIERIY